MQAEVTNNVSLVVRDPSHSVETMQFMGRSVDSNYKTFLKERKHKSMF